MNINRKDTSVNINR